jgi:sugar lactone lactonase YvrE
MLWEEQAMNRRRLASLVSAGLLIGASLVTANPASAKGHLDVLLDGLSAPKGIAADQHSIFVGQGWFFGPPAPILEYLLIGPNRGTARAVSDPTSVVDIAGTPDGAGWAIGADGVLYRQATPDAAIEAVLDITAYQISDPDPTDKDVPPNPTESNPNGLTGLASNDVLIADAAGNDLLRVSPDGTAVTVARWPVEVVPTNDPNLPPTLPAEAVPTTVAIGPDGWAYVGQLVGFPGTPGTAHIWRVNPNAVGATCSVNVVDPNCSVWKSGFTSIFDIAFNPHNDALYVYEIAKDGWLALEAGFATGDFPPAVLLEVKGDNIQELVPGELSQPGGVAVGNDGAVYVTDGMFTNGRLLRVRGS